MNTDLLVELNRRFGRADTVRFEAGPGGLPTVRVTNTAAEAVVSLHGAHVLSFMPCQQRDLLWLSPRARFADGQPIRCGIPICWPWFCAPPPGVEGANHGLVCQITVAKRGSRGTVVWNSAAGRAAQLDDLGADHFAGFVCVEPANRGRDARSVAPGESATLGLRVAVASMDRTAG